MKTIGTPSTESEARAERAIALLFDTDFEARRYAPATSPMASPSYHAVESSSYLVTHGEGETNFFLRLGADEVAELVDDRVAANAGSRFSKEGLSPRFFGYSPVERAMLFAHLDEGWRSAKIDDLIGEGPAARLVSMQKAVAAGAPFGRLWSVFDGIDTIWQLVCQTDAPRPNDVDWMLRWIGPMRRAVEAAGVDYRPAHGDPHSSNVMIGPAGALMLVDFDMAGDMDPYYQLGVQMNELYQFESQMKPLLEMHDGGYREAAFSRCRIYAAADDLYWALRSLLLSARSPLREVEFLKYAAWRFLRCRMLLGLPGFEERLRSL